MKKIYFILSIVVFFQTAKAQDTLKHYELGPTLVGVGVETLTNYRYYQYYYGKGNLPFNVMNGLLFRYIKNRVGLRVQLNYYKAYISFVPGNGCADCSSLEEKSRDIKIGAGVQFSVINKKDWLYTFTDMAYRNILANGSVSGWPEYYDFTIKQNGIESDLGMGVKIKIIKSIYLSPEFCYTIFYHDEDYRKISRSSYKNYAPVKKTQMDQYTFIKLHLTVKF